MSMIPFLHQDGSLPWEGRVVDVIDTRVGKLQTKESSEQLAPGFYVKVRILGVHTDDVAKLRNEQLPWVEVSGTVLGSGRAGSGATPNIQPGDHVYGIYVNGRPVIWGVQLCDPQNTLSTFQGLNGYDAFSVYRLGTTPISRIDVPGGGQFSLPPEKAWDPRFYSLSDSVKGDPQTYSKMACPAPNEVVNAAGMSSKISETIKKIESYQKSVRKYEAAALKYINDKEQVAQEWIRQMSKWLNGKIEWLLSYIQRKITAGINDASAAASKQIPINGRFAAREAQSAVVEAIICLFKNMMKAIAGIMEKVMIELVNRYVNVPLCAIENFLKTLLSNVFGMISSALSGIANILRGIISNVAGFINQVLGFAATILKLFECELNEKDSGVKEWHILDGANTQNAKLTLDIEGIINNAKSLANNFKNIIDPNTLNINANLLNFSNIFASLTCNAGPLPCGPPTIQFLGGGGQGTRGNAIISAVGEIIGVDIITPGNNYTSVPTVSFIDACGKGYAATGIAILGKVPTVVLKAVGPTSDGSYVLVWRSQNAVTATTNFGATSLNGNTKVNPATTTTYRIVVSDSSGLTAEASVTITPGVSTIGDGDSNEGATGETITFENFVIEDVIDQGVIAVVIENSGFGYIPQPDGSLGGDGRVWSESDETIVRRYDPINGDGFGGIIGVDSGAGISTSGSDGVVDPNNIQPQVVPIIGAGNRPDLYTYDLPYPPDSLIDLNPGDLILTPANSSTITVVDVNGNDIATVLPGVPTLIDGTGSTTAPPLSGQLSVSLTQETLPTSDDGKYPVMLKICSVTIQDPGVNYSEDDIIEVTPSNGAVLKPIIGQYGTISGVEVMQSGMGFTESPTIRIKSETGYGAVLIPYLCVNNIGDLTEDERNALAQEGKILQVVDCVGKV